MKAIPQELQAYFPTTPFPDRPWWEFDGLHAEFKRSDRRVAYSTSVRAEIDKANPLPPPPILVGQVWALQVPGSPLRVGTVTHTWQDAIVTVGLSGFGMNLRGDLLLEVGFLLSCPYGYAPWSGPETL